MSIAAVALSLELPALVSHPKCVSRFINCEHRRIFTSFGRVEQEPPTYVRLLEVKEPPTDVLCKLAQMKDEQGGGRFTMVSKYISYHLTAPLDELGGEAVINVTET
ncbi:T-complex protein 1, alpha subunit [Culex quinquefasciatus]|uniref:T-complex protein 1, alpha subunit n=1 Tax=Culex quinquefasciatus TaxID=7176 RepID=B0W095_CULQU|nr:T-complex protein 1, alpha subunit [Culex quinquefasciatus]|eukprot:XP_001842129.1 T-complex protein 1, alpha subunit [Culex quinquefasciatus]